MAKNVLFRGVTTIYRREKMTKSVTEQGPINPLLQEILPQMYISTMFEDFLNAKKKERFSEGNWKIFVLI